jgi:hypothetical protein
VYDRSQATPVSVTAPDDTPNINVTLEPGGTISGHVYQSDGTTPVEGAIIWVYDYSTLSVVYARASTSSDGSYTTPGVPSGQYGVQVEAAGYIAEWYNGVVDPGDATPVPVTVPDDTPGIDFTLEVPSDVHVSGPDRVVPDSDFTATIDIDQVADLNAAQYDVTFDPLVLRLDDITPGQIDSTELPVQFNEVSPGTYRVVQSMGLGAVSGSGYLSVLYFHVVGSLGQSSTVELSNGLLSGMANEIPATWTGHTVDVSVLPGDANGDGNINVLDMTKVARIILLLDAETPGCDANLDGFTNVLDITKIARIILGLD